MTGATSYEIGTGHARSHGAITVVNAIATGRGAAIGIDLHTDAEVTLTPHDAPQHSIAVTIDGEPGENPALAEACVRRVLDKVGVAEHVHADVRTTSSIPVSRGLKSSSAAANAITLATLAALGQTVGDGAECLMSDEDCVRLGVDAALDAGVTITGAYDDATACYFGGLVVTDNLDRAILARTELDDLEVLLVIPAFKVRTRDTATAPTYPLRGIINEAHRMALAGNWQEAMLRNSLAYGGAYGMSNRLALSMLDTGAIAAGISGTGPSQAVVIRRDDWDCFTGILATLAPEARVLVAHVNRQKAHASKGPLEPAPETLLVQSGVVSAEDDP